MTHLRTDSNVSKERIFIMKAEKIGYVEAIALITIVMINKIILNTPKDIIAKTRSIIMFECCLYINYCNCFSMANHFFI